MPAHRKRPIPPARMVELLADAKRSMLAAGTLPLGCDDPDLARRADRVDRRRWRLTAELADLDDDGVTRPARDELAAQLEQAAEAFARMLAFLPAMRAFEEAWESCWQAMVAERAWPHNTGERRRWRAGMLSAKPEYRATFLGMPTPYQRWRQQVEAVESEEALSSSPDMLVGYAVA